MAAFAAAHVHRYDAGQPGEAKQLCVLLDLVHGSLYCAAVATTTWASRGVTAGACLQCFMQMREFSPIQEVF
jgi:hypothetical protein